jgi:hypothetical protein
MTVELDHRHPPPSKSWMGKMKIWLTWCKLVQLYNKANDAYMSLNHI